MSIYSRHFSDPAVMVGCTDIVPVGPIAESGDQPQFELIVTEQDKGLALDLAITAAEHLMRLCGMNEPLWVKGRSSCGVMEVMNVEEYGRLFQWPVHLKQQQQQGGEFKTEATRDSGIVMVNSISLVDAFSDAVSSKQHKLVME